MFCFLLFIPENVNLFLLFFHVVLSESRKNKIWYFCLKGKGLSAFNIAFDGSLLQVIFKRAQTSILLMLKYFLSALILMNTLGRSFLEKAVLILCFR